MQAESSIHRSLSDSSYPFFKDESRRGIEQALGYSILPPIEPSHPVPIPDHASTVQSPECDPSFFSSPAAMFLGGFTAAPPAPAQPDDEGQIISGYTLGPIVGNGASSIIRKATSVSGGIVAVKIVRLSTLDRAETKQLENEHETWASLSHEHLLPLFSAVQTSHAYFFVTQYCPAGSLFDILKRDGTPALPQDDAGMMFRQVVRGLRHLHEVAGLVHRDIKLENVLVDEMGVCRITDFGFAKKYGDTIEEDAPVEVSKPGPSKSLHLSLHRQKNPRHRSSTPAQLTSSNLCTFQPGSLPYAAPELLSSQQCPLDPAQDIWALGVLLYTLLTGNLPFKDSFEPRLQLKIMRGTYEVPTGIGRGAERVLGGCLRLSVDDRWSIAMVDEIAWGVGWGDVHHDEEPFIPSPSRSRSRPAQRDPWNLSPIEEREMFERPRMDAAQRRSSSRAERSRSRAPTSRQSRSSSRQPLSAIPGVLLRAMSSSSTSSSTVSTSTFARADSASRERGRRPTKVVCDDIYIASRSNSPLTNPGASPQSKRAMNFVRELHASQYERGRRAHPRTNDDKSDHLFPAEWTSPTEPRSRSKGGLLDLTGVGKLLSWVRGEHLPDTQVSRRSGSVPPTHGTDGTHTPLDIGLRSRSVARN